MKRQLRGRSTTRSFKQVPYTRHDNKPKKSRGDRAKWSRIVEELLQASDQQIVKILIKDKLLKDWTSKPCPHCFEGTCGPLKKVGKRGLTRGSRAFTSDLVGVDEEFEKEVVRRVTGRASWRMGLPPSLSPSRRRWRRQGVRMGRCCASTACRCKSSSNTH